MPGVVTGGGRVGNKGWVRGCAGRALRWRPRDRLPRPDRVRRGRDHLPPARLLGAHRAGRAERPGGARLRLAAALRLPRHPGLKVVKRLLDTGISLQQIRAAVQHLRDHGTEDLAQVTLMSDGVSVYECTSPDEVVDLLGRRPGRLRHRARPGLAGGRGRAGRAARGPRRGRPDRRRQRRLSWPIAAARKTGSAVLARSGDGTTVCRALFSRPGETPRPAARLSPGAARRGAEGARHPRNLSGTKDRPGRRSGASLATDGEP